MTTLRVLTPPLIAGGVVPWTSTDAGDQAPGLESADRVRAVQEGLLDGGAAMVPVRPKSASAGLAAVLELIREIHDPGLLDALATTLEPGEARLFADLAAPGLSADTPAVSGSWDQALAAARCAMSAAQLAADGQGPTYALVRPPGHHAGPGFFGGYCYLNNAVVAAIVLQRSGWDRVAVLDLDHHLGNGTLAHAQRRPEIGYASIHVSGPGIFPYRFPDAAGLIALECSPSADEYLGHVSSLLTRFENRALVVSVGFDGSRGDPHGCWELPPEVWGGIGVALGARLHPTVLVQEGGYAIDTNYACARALAEGTRT